MQLSEAQARYAKGWSVNADNYRAQGLYDDLAEELIGCGNIQKILDIGCGCGHGLEALRKVLPGDASLIIGVDENSECVARAVKRLGLGMVPATHQRLKSKRQLSGRFKTQIMKGRIPRSGSVHVVNADMQLEDPTFASWLTEHGSFDAVTMWFMGVHKGRSMTATSRDLGIRSDKDNREILEKIKVSVATSLLRLGGILQLVNRYFSTDIESYRATLLEQEEFKLKNSHFDLISLSPYEYTEPLGVGSIRVSQPGINNDDLPHYAVSTLAKKKKH